MKKLMIYFFTFLLFFIVHCTLTIKDCMCQWIYQYAGYPGTPYDMKFFDANTGYISTDSSKIYKTTNAGNNWSFDRTLCIIQMQKLNDSTMFCMGYHLGQNYKIFKLFQKGQRWDSAAIPFYIGFATYTNMCFVNKDTGWICGFDGNYFHIWRTINGGISYQSQITGIGAGTIFFLNKKINGEYYGWCSSNSNLYKTTNSGVSWFPIAGISAIAYYQIAMLDENTGWVTTGDTFIWKTTNGGTNYFKQFMPNIPNEYSKSIQKITVLNSNLIYGIGGARWFGPGIVKGIIWKTTNGGLNWGFQQPDTSYPISRYYALDFIDSLTGWAAGYRYNGNIIHTTNGGGEIIYVGINNLSSEIPEDFKLYQNYPNPFNSSTAIEFDVPKNAVITLILYDILGREIMRIIDTKEIIPGSYKALIDLNNYNFSGGIYFYKIIVSDTKKYNVFSETKRMVFVK